SFRSDPFQCAHDGARAAVPVETLDGPANRRPIPTSCQRFAQSRCESMRVGGWHQQAVHSMLDDLRYTSDARCNDRKPARHCLQCDVRQPLTQARKAQHVTRVHPFRDVPMYLSAYQTASSVAVDLRRLTTGADENEIDIVQISEIGKRVRQDCRSLHWQKIPNVEDPPSLRAQVCVVAGICPIAWSERFAVDTVVARGRGDAFIREPLSQCFTPREHSGACAQRSEYEALESRTPKERVHVATLNRGGERELEFVGQQHY